MRLIDAIIAAMAWPIFCMIFWPKTIAENPEIALLTLAIVVAGALAGGDK